MRVMRYRTPGLFNALYFGRGRLSLFGNTWLNVANSATSAPQAGTAIRGHWHIGNTLHYTRDVTCCEDQSRIRHSSGIPARIRSFAYNILQRNRTSTFSRERYAAALGGLDALLKLSFS